MSGVWATRSIWRKRWGAAVILVSLFFFSTALGAAERPNILLITADNLGFGDLRCFHPESPIPTPTFDRLCREGARLTQFYTASPTCTVSRACLLTGRVPQRHGLTRQLPGVAGNYGAGLGRSEILIPQVLRSGVEPYATGCFGKWNIGFAPGSRPTERGFDEFIGHASGNMDYYRHNYRERHDLYSGVDALHREGTYATTLFADAAIDFIKRRSKEGRPWFCYLPFNAPHFPSPGNRRDGEPNIWQAPVWAFAACGLSSDESSPEKRYRAVVYALDFAVGRVLDCLRDLGVEKKTFVFFMSDNGSFRLGREGIDVGTNVPLRSGGVTCWEGGLRVVAMARYPGRIPAGSVVDTPIWSVDLMMACAAMSKASLPTRVHLDGMNPLPFLYGNAKSHSRSFFFSYKSHAALRMGQWKIVRERETEPWQLYNVVEDAGEQINQATQLPNVVRQLEAERDRWIHSF